MTTRRDFLKLSFSAALITASPSTLSAFSGYGLNKPVPIRSFESGPSENVFSSREYFEKIRNFNHAFSDDLIADSAEFALIRSCQKKTYALMRYIGFGNFNIVNFDEALKYMNNVSALTPFTKQELNYLDMLFARDASVYGFFGERIFDSLTDNVDQSKLEKIPGSGHYVYKSSSLSIYRNITTEMKSLTLTSGVRSVVKQLHLFLSKVVETKGNLSMASRSIAHVGYSYHGIGDFDVGIKGWGYDNFTDKFATTDEYSKLMSKGYMRIRYDKKNPYGVRFEPWHVKVV
ncbi:MAG: peptidase M15 [Denitrovibrio sp.]|nr:MAG: peptidase M15 [Denitrovibrio sp.]